MTQSQELDVETCKPSIIPSMAKTFLEIGTCDFDTLLPLCENGWRGYFVEPIYEYAKNVADECKKNKYRATVTCCAISSYDGELEMYISNDNGGPSGWSKGISHAVNQKGEKLLEYEDNKFLLKEIKKVPCYTLDTFLNDNNINDLDYLKIDVEGHETDIIEAYSWRVKPTVIKLEHLHIDDINMKRILEEQGYIVYVEQNDIYAVR